jgi:hypothetical protein
METANGDIQKRILPSDTKIDMEHFRRTMDEFQKEFETICSIVESTY